MTTHELKTDPEVFSASLRGDKNYEIRLNDRGYQCGDMLILKETVQSGNEMLNGAPLLYTGRILSRWVTHILDGYGLQEGWIILSLKPA